MVCESCGVEAPTKYVELYQNIGLLILNLHKSCPLGKHSLRP